MQTQDGKMFKMLGKLLPGRRSCTEHNGTQKARSQEQQQVEQIDGPFIEVFSKKKGTNNGHKGGRHTPNQTINNNNNISLAKLGADGSLYLYGMTSKATNNEKLKRKLD